MASILNVEFPRFSVMPDGTNMPSVGAMYRLFQLHWIRYVPVVNLIFVYPCAFAHVKAWFIPSVVARALVPLLDILNLLFSTVYQPAASGLATVCVGVGVGAAVFVAVGFGVAVAVGFGVAVAVGFGVAFVVGFGVAVVVGFGVVVAEPLDAVFILLLSA